MKEVEELYGKMLAVFEEKTGFTMDDTADLAVRLYAAAAQIQSLYAYSDWAMNQSFPQTATGEYLDYHAALRGITRKAGTRASGILRFKIDQALEDNLPISAGTVCTTAGLVRFVTTHDGEIAAGELYADIPAEAESVGASGNVGDYGADQSAGGRFGRSQPARVYRRKRCGVGRRSACARPRQLYSPAERRERRVL